MNKNQLYKALAWLFSFPLDEAVDGDTGFMFVIAVFLN